nr:MAG TPA: MOLONEY MURINE LEUKEMIA VIRUS P15, COAT PROTEIN, POLYPROTEIN, TRANSMEMBRANE.7A [Caudoviricetes sp.]
MFAFCNVFRKIIYEKCCFYIDIQRNSLYNIDIERRLRGAREQTPGGDAP